MALLRSRMESPDDPYRTSGCCVSRGIVASLPRDRGGVEQLGFEYLSPLPGSLYHLPETNIILRPGGNLDPGSVDKGKFRINGSKSGSHQGRLKLSDDRKEVTFQPDVPFTPGEVVTCSLDPGLVTDTGEPVPPAEFTFTVAGPEREALRDFVVPVEGDEDSSPESGGSPVAPLRTAALPESLPPDFPHIQAAVYARPPPAGVPVQLRVRGDPKPSYLMTSRTTGLFFLP